MAGSNAFRQMAAQLNETKNLDTVLVGTSFLDEGEHDVTIQSVDMTKAEENRITVVFADEKGRVYNERGFIMSQDEAEMSFTVRLILSATLCNKEALAKFLEIGANDDRVFEMLTGMKLRVNLQRGPGFVIKVKGDGVFAAYEVSKGGVVAKEPIPDTEAEQLVEAKELAEAQGLKRSFLRIRGAEATHAVENVVAFMAAAEARTKGTEANTQVKNKVV